MKEVYYCTQRRLSGNSAAILFCTQASIRRELSGRAGRGAGYEEDGKTDDQFPFTSAYPQNELILQRQGPIKFDGLLTKTQNGTNRDRVILTGDWK